MLPSPPDTEKDPCMLNPMNCTDGFSWSVWEKMSFGADVVDGGGTKKYIMSTGGDYNGAKGQAWPGFALYHQGMDLVALVSTGVQVWELRVSGQLYNNSWVEIGIRWSKPDLDDPKASKLAETPEGREKMGGLEMFIGGFPDIVTGDASPRKVGHSLLPESTDRGSPKWIAQPALLVDGDPVMMLGCHKNSLMYSKGMDFTGYAGTKDAPAEFDEMAIWRHRFSNAELIKFLGGYEADFGNINPEQMKAMLGNVDLSDPEQAGAAANVAAQMIMGTSSTTPKFPTRTPEPTTTMTMAAGAETSSMPTTTTTMPPQDPASLRKTMLGKQDIMSSLLSLDGVNEGSDPRYIEKPLGNGKIAAALLIGTEDNKKYWDAVNEETRNTGAMRTVKELEEFMLATVGSVNTSAFDQREGEFETSFFQSQDDTMRYSTFGDDFVMNVDKLPMADFRPITEGEDTGEDDPVGYRNSTKDEGFRLAYPDYQGNEWNCAKKGDGTCAKWNQELKDTFTVPTGMFSKTSCSQNPMTILTAVYNGLPEIVAKRRNPVTIKSKEFFIDSRVVSVRAKINYDQILGTLEETFNCEPDSDYMDRNPVKLKFYHRVVQGAKRDLVSPNRKLLWHTDDYWSGLEVRHCVWWNERFGYNGAWDDSKCEVVN